MKFSVPTLLSVTSKKYHKLILVVGLPFSGKTRILKEFIVTINAHYINLGLELSEQLLDYTVSDRKQALDILFNEIVKRYSGGVLLFDNIELLFDPDLDVNVLDLFLKLSRHIVCVVAWTGTFIDGVLRFGDPGFWGYKSYNVSDIEVIDLNGESGEV